MRRTHENVPKKGGEISFDSVYWIKLVLVKFNSEVSRWWWW